MNRLANDDTECASICAIGKRTTPFRARVNGRIAAPTNRVVDDCGYLLAGELSIASV
jgi:hypothetical protein